MKILVILHSYLRENLPAEARGQTELEIPEGSCIQDVIDLLKLPETVAVAVNAQLQRDRRCMLKEGDRVQFLRPGSGG